MQSTVLDLSRQIEALAEIVAAKVFTQLEAGGATIRPRLLTIAQAAVYLGRTDKGVRHLASQGAFRTVRGDGRVQFDINDIDRWIEQNKV